MEKETREIYKSSLIKGVFGKYNAKKESLLAEITLILESDNAGPDGVSALFEDKISELACCENVIAQLEIMFTAGMSGEAPKKECCDDKETCSNE